MRYGKRAITTMHDDDALRRLVRRERRKETSSQAGSKAAEVGLWVREVL